MRYIFVHLVMFLLFVAVLYAPGYSLPRSWFPVRMDRALLLLTRLSLGIALWIVFAFVACSVGMYRPIIFRTAAGAAIVMGLVLASRRMRRPLKSFTVRPFRPRLSEGLLAGTIVITLLISCPLALIPAMTWDCDTYHLIIPKLYTQAAGFRPIDFNVYSNWPLNIELLFGLAMQLQDWHIANLLHFAFGCSTLVAIYAFTRARRGNYAAPLAALLFLGNPVVLYEFSTAYVDLALSFFVFMTFWYLHEYGGDPGKGRRFLLLAGICAGVAAGAKMTAFMIIACVSTWFLLTQWRQRKLRTCLAPFLVFCCAPGLLLLAPWLVKSWYYTGNPVYPFLYGLFGGIQWNHELAARFHRWHWSIGMGRNWTSYLMLPINVVLFGGEDYGHFQGEVSRAWIAWLPAAIVGAWRSSLIRSLLLLSLMWFACWAATSQQVRFLIPILPFLAIAASSAIADLLAMLPRGRVNSDVTAVVSAIAVVATVIAHVDNLKAYSRICRAANVSGLYEVVADKDGERPSGTVRSVFSFINQRLPEDARIMMLNKNQGFFCDREYIADSFFEASQMADLLRKEQTPASLMALLASHGITHILWHDRYRGIRYPDVLYELLSDVTRVSLVFQSHDGADSLFMLRKPP